ncbi:hypothetical protein [Variovorax sp. JS1663]|uniref:hypothetical protein n=1 Tax=Variovorax sp. JS1663 TaxID=1851577 RepID=UPI00117E07FE|nr:hypothetical protein [Variovorax sp. JS1663]
MTMETKGAFITAVATLGGAALGALGAVGAAWIGLSKPSEKQLVNSDQFRAMVQEEALLKSELKTTREKLQTSEAAIAQLREDLRLARTKPSASAPPPGPTGDAVATAPKPPQQRDPAEPAAVPVPRQPAEKGPRRTEIMLRASIPVLTSDGLTATLLEINRLGGTVVVNGHKVSHMKPGRRLAVAAGEAERCFVEVMDLSAADANPLTMRLDHVCEPRRR